MKKKATWYLLFKFGQHICEDSSIFDVFLDCATRFKQAEYVALLRYIQSLAKFVDNLRKKKKQFHERYKANYLNQLVVIWTTSTNINRWRQSNEPIITLKWLHVTVAKGGKTLTSKSQSILKWRDAQCLPKPLPYPTLPLPLPSLSFSLSAQCQCVAVMAVPLHCNILSTLFF